MPRRTTDRISLIWNPFRRRPHIRGDTILRHQRLIAEAYHADPKLEQPSSYIEDPGEVNWLVDDAVRMEVPVPVIAQSVMQLFASREQRKNWARAIVLMRHGFGGHPYGPDESIARERREGRVGEIYQPPVAKPG